MQIKAVLYLSGPMTGYEDYNYPMFFAVAEQLRQAGYGVINPADFSKGTADWTDCLRRDAALVAMADGVATLPGWELSRGANVEVTLGRGLGLPVESADDLIKGKAEIHV